ncbi:hypothetical protein [Aurantibacillus circumpalustris]|uniref:hypothetical protein n=1 Tax=Aurantibacillus circumpalustris TaxID=3036359 RepID=UPI00295C1FC6|nr:hypothetical protein [Aurantibacillus circumpalustris]
MTTTAKAKFKTESIGDNPKLIQKVITETLTKMFQDTDLFKDYILTINVPEKLHEGIKVKKELGLFLHSKIAFDFRSYTRSTIIFSSPNRLGYWEKAICEHYKHVKDFYFSISVIANNEVKGKLDEELNLNFRESLGIYQEPG